MEGASQWVMFEGKPRSIKTRGGRAWHNPRVRRIWGLLLLAGVQVGALDDISITFLGDIMAHEANHRVSDYRSI